MIHKLPDIELSNGVLMPCMGQGTYPMEGKILYRALCGALECGCTLFDTAHSYPNEGSIGIELSKAMRHTGTERKKVFLTSKIGDSLDNGMPVGRYFYNSDSCVDRNHRRVVKMMVEESLRKLRTDYIDLLLIHWPYYDCLEEIWLSMEEIYKEGKARAIGVSNHQERHLERIKKISTVAPMVNQIYISPLNTQQKTLNYCSKNGIIAEAYSPLMFLRDDNGFVESEEILSICQKYSKSAAQIVLRWNFQKGIIPIPKASSPIHIRANYDIFDFSLTSEEMAFVDSFNEDYQYLPESIYCPGY